MTLLRKPLAGRAGCGILREHPGYMWISVEGELIKMQEVFLFFPVQARSKHTTVICDSAGASEARPSTPSMSIRGGRLDPSSTEDVTPTAHTVMKR